MKRLFVLSYLEITYVARKGFFHLLSVNFFTQFLGFGTSLLVAKFLTPVELGNIKIIQSYTTLFIVLAGFGLNSAVIKYCSEIRSVEEKESILNQALIKAIGSTVIAMLILIGLAYSTIITPSSFLANWLLIYALIIPFGVTTEILIAYLLALKRIREMAKAQAIIKIQFFGLITFCTWFWGFPGFIFSTIAAYAVGIIPLLWQIGPKFIKANKYTLPTGFTHTALFSVLANGVSILGFYGDIFVLDHFAVNRVEIGFYALATIFVQAARQVTQTAQSISTPYLSERSSERNWFQRQLKLNQFRASALSLVVATGVYVMGWILIKLVYGQSYDSTMDYLLILLLRYILWSSFAIIGVAIFALGFVRYNFLNALVTTIFSLVVSYFLLNKIGISGVAWAQVLSAALMLIMTYFTYWRINKSLIKIAS